MPKWTYACTTCHQAPCKCNSQRANRMANHKRGANARGYTYRWQKASKVYLANNPLCVRCKATGKVVPAAHVDHVVPHRGSTEGDLFWDEDNWQALCAKCHGKKTHREGAMGERWVVTGCAGCGKSTYVEQRAKVGDLIWDYDVVIASLVAGLDNKRDNPPTLIPLMEQIRHTFINYLRTDATKRTAWVIAANPTTAAKIARQTGGFLVNLAGGREKENGAFC